MQTEENLTWSGKLPPLDLELLYFHDALPEQQNFEVEK